jgi:hypothetical protein
MKHQISLHSFKWTQENTAQPGYGIDMSRMVEGIADIPLDNGNTLTIVVRRPNKSWNLSRAEVLSATEVTNENQVVRDHRTSSIELTN